MGDLDGRVALVTGASRGIGRAIALRLAEDGATVGVNYNSSEAAAAEVVNLIEGSGGKALALHGDVSSAEAVQDIVGELVRAYGRIDILVNNAGIIRDTLLLRMSEDDWDAVLDTNLKSAFICTKAVVRHMMKQRWGRIVTVSSIVGIIGNPGQANYAAAKAGLIAFTKSIAREFASRGITANAIAPGFIDTDITNHLPQELRDSLLKQIPVERLGQPAEIAELAAFLASDRSSYITGQVVQIDGGLAM